MAFIRTVLGDIAPDELGPTHGHEHVLFRPAGDRDDDLRKLDPGEAVEELASFRSVGGSGLIDATVAELGRDPLAVSRVSEATGVHVVLATGHTAQEWWDGFADLGSRSVGELAEEIVGDLTHGVDGSGVKAGVIKVGTSLGEVTAGESRIIEAAAQAHHGTGAPITTHTTGGTMGWEQLRLLSTHGVSPDRVCLGHLDRHLDYENLVPLAESGAYLGFDQISKERHGPDTERARLIARLVEEGHVGRILLGSDMARRSDLQARGGPGLTYLLTRFVPLLSDLGLSNEDLDRILIDNPRSFLTWS